MERNTPAGRPLALVAALSVALWACNGDETTPLPDPFADANGDGVADVVAATCAVSPLQVYRDDDGDGLGDDARGLLACQVGAGWVTRGDDCDDTRADVGAPTTWFADADGDGRGDDDATQLACTPPEGHVAAGGDPQPDCATDDTDECGRCGNPGPPTWHADVDGDGLGDTRVPVVACTAPDGFVDNADDAEPDCATNDTDDCGVCAGGDRDKDCAGVCNGTAVPDMCGVCAGPGQRTFYADLDRDGRGDPAAPVTACVPPPDHVDNANDPEPDCATNDTDVCGVCGGPGWVRFYRDSDGDGRGVEADFETGCEPPDGFAREAGDPEPDCATDDTDACSICGGPGFSLYYRDADGDALGDPDNATAACATPLGFVDNADDPEPSCATNDTDACGVCGGPGATTWYRDLDGDGLGDPAASVAACDAPDGYVINNRDRQPTCTTNDTDTCGVCGGANRDLDCFGDCFGTAALDACFNCAGGNTGVEPQSEDECEPCEATGNAEVIVQWHEIPAFSNVSGPFTFQLRIFANGEFRFEYHDLGTLPYTATVGYQTALGARALELGFDTRFADEHPFVHFRRLTDGGVAVEYTGTYPWQDISLVGERHELADDGTIEVDLGFTFSFWGVDFTQIVVSANGVVSLSDVQPTYQNTSLPDPFLGALIAPLWDDLDPTRGGAVYVYRRSGTCTPDCAGVRGGFAIRDACGVCAGGTTGRAPNVDMDCNDTCFGSAAVDGCGVCAGGTTGVEPRDGTTCPHGPDLLVDADELRRDVFVDYVDVEPGSCLLGEGCVRGTGRRKVVRFSTMIANIGDRDLQLGRPPSTAVSSGAWHWDDCHGHHHYEAYARYDLFSVATGDNLEIGSKSGFCVMDIDVYDPEITTACNGYNCGDQGITAGCQDTYTSGLQCQWIDVTGLDNGDYDLTVTTNPFGEIPELDATNNAATIRIRLDGDLVDVID